MKTCKYIDDEKVFLAPKSKKNESREVKRIAGSQPATGTQIVMFYSFNYVCCLS